MMQMQAPQQFNPMAHQMAVMGQMQPQMPQVGYGLHPQGGYMPQMSPDSYQKQISDLQHKIMLLSQMS